MAPHPDNSATPFNNGDQEDDDPTGMSADDAEVGEEPTTPAVTLDPVQAATAGLTGAKAGDSFTVKITVTNADEGITASIDPGSAVKDTPKPMGGKQAIRSPEDMGFGDDEGFQPPSATL